MSSIVAEGLNLAALGMGTVFVFLTLLVFATVLMSTLVQRTAPPRTVGKAALDSKKLAAISAAVHQHKLSRRR